MKNMIKHMAVLTAITAAMSGSFAFAQGQQSYTSYRWQGQQVQAQQPAPQANPTAKWNSQKSKTDNVKKDKADTNKDYKQVKKDNKKDSKKASKNLKNPPQNQTPSQNQQKQQPNPYVPYGQNR